MKCPETGERCRGGYYCGVVGLCPPLEGAKPKLRMDLIPPWFLESLAEALTIGADKHGDGLHSSAPTLADCDGAIMRHHCAWRAGETHASDDGQHHGAAMVARILQRMDLEREAGE